MSALERAIRGLTGVFLAVSMTCAAGCAADASDAEPTQATEADLSASQRKALTDTVKAAYEDAVKNRRDYWLAGEKTASPSKLRGQAKTDFRQNADTSKDYGYGYPEVRVATVDGKTVYAMSGIVSDTGDILGFYDASGKELCEAYSGQGENPNANGVDWWK